MQICTSPQTDNYASNPPLSFYRPNAVRATNSVKALKAMFMTLQKTKYHNVSNYCAKKQHQTALTEHQ